MGALGLVGSGVLGAIALVIARSRSVPVALDPWATVTCMALSMGLAIVSGLAAMRSLRRADPATLLR